MIVKIINEIVGRVQYRYNNSTSERYINFLRKRGCTIGEGCKFHVPSSIIVDVTRPCLMTIGNNVNITQGVTILTHGADWHVLRELYHKPFGSVGKVTIKDNVFIGVHSIILKNVTINEYAIIGAGSVVTKDVPPRTVVAGNPAKPIMNIDEYYRKRQKVQIKEACEYAKAIREKHNRLPVPEDFGEFFFLFIEREPIKFKGIPVKKQTGKYYDNFLKSKPYFKDFNSFLKYSNLI